MTHTNRLTPEQTFGGQVREAREARGWSQEALARRLREEIGLELHQTAIARLERGDRTIRFNEVTALARVLNLELGSYFAAPQLTDEEFEQLMASLELVNKNSQELHQRQVELEAELADVRERLANLDGVRRGMMNTVAAQAPREGA
ncbi:helix-turn-helix domain-containing protein [Micromonospora maritima]|uniref:helix-turn-helix domain-containing protein n=1 Tax=Micromonospora maritima TaxID=986711 RepID=UPI00157BEAEA|nr:helix-turn-helix transcriptional regulator [Micromonospora maritima]